MRESELAALVAFLEEDLGRGDVTSEALIPRALQARGRVQCGQPATLAGLEEAIALAREVDARVSASAVDGDQLEAGDEVLEIQGAARAILGVERTMLNLLSHLSGVATVTRRAVTEVEAKFTGCRAQAPPRVTATRKTLPGIRALQKKAVVLGGGLPHRFDLSAAVLIKDNHLVVAPDIGAAVARVRETVGDQPIEVEVETLEQALAAARAGADRVMLDNLAPDDIGEIVARLASAGLRDAVSLEASGGITVETVGSYADTGVDFISMGMLTMSAPHVDYSLHFST